MEANMISNRLPQLINQKGISIRQLSRETGITYSTIWAMVHGQRRSVQFEVLDAVCDALAVQPGDIYRRVAAAEARHSTQPSRRPEPSEPEASEQPGRTVRGNKASEWRSW
jgi:putative transcriptional regulator